MNRKLRILRITVAVIVTAAVTTFLATSSVAVAQTLGWSMKLQIVPLMLAGATIQVLLLLGLTIIFGRIYCSALCPLGVMQDIFFRARRLPPLKKKLSALRFAPAQNTLRLGILAAFIILILTGANAIALIIEPTAIYTHIVRMFTQTETLTIPAAAITATVIIFFAMISVRRGRIWCNTICPVGTALGLIAARSHLRISINPDLCTACGKCQDVCKAQCIDLTQLTVDNSRCVCCFDCLAVCPGGAVRYTDRPATPASPLMQRVPE